MNPRSCLVLAMIGLLPAGASAQALEERAQEPSASQTQSASATSNSATYQPIASELLAPGSSHPALAPSAAPAGDVSSPAILRPTSQTVPTVGEAMRLCDTFMQQIVQGRYSTAFAAFWPYFPLTPEKQARLYDETAQQLVAVEAQFGRSLGYVFLDARTLSDTVLRCRFFQRFELEVVTWEFDFYNAGDGWRLNAVAFDGSTAHLFD